jgi:hypothetical protein
MLVVLVTVVSLFLLLISIRPTIFDSYVKLDSQIIVSTTGLKNISYSDIDRVKEEVQVALNYIPQILGIEYRGKTRINIIDKGICYADGGIISLSVSHISDNSAPIIHEVAHILTKHEHNSFFSEGLAVYFQEKFGRSDSFPNFSAPLDELVRNYKGQLIDIPKLNNNNEIFGQVGTEVRKIAYLEAGSFFNFLVEKYGEQKLADLHNSESLNYKEVYGKDISKLEDDWKSYLFETPLSI